MKKCGINSMNHTPILLIFAILITAISIPAYGQTITDHVVINEVDTNPFGDDSLAISEWVELYNPTDSDVDLSGWKIASTTVLKKTFTIPDGTIISPDQLLIFTYTKVWFTDSSESIELRNSADIVIDKTPFISDLKNDFLSWQRSYDGYDDWEFSLGNAGGSNGKLNSFEASSAVEVVLFTDKINYNFDETAIIQGTVSEKVFVEVPTFQAAPILINISGPNFDQAISLYPDTNLSFQTSLDLVQVLGISIGTYDVSVTYAGVTEATSFSVEFEVVEDAPQDISSFNIETNKSEYFLNESIQFTAFTSEIIPFESMMFTVVDPTGKQIDSGSLFTADGNFNTNVSLSPINPIYGTYTITADYFEQTAFVNFDIVETSVDTSDDASISNPLFFTISISEFTDNDCRNCMTVIESNASEVLLNQYLTFSGIIPNFVGTDGLTVPSPYYNSVEFSFTTSSGKPVFFVGHTLGEKDVVGNPILFTTTAIPDDSGEFITHVQIPPVVFSEGNYVVKAKYGNSYKSEPFSVVSEPSFTQSSIDGKFENGYFTPSSKTIIEKINRISDDLISITTQEKIIDEQLVQPRVLSGSMITPSKDTLSDVNLQVMSESGICIIGTGEDCLVTESTRKPGQIFDVVQVDGIDLNVRYSGPDVRLEKFSILPESSDDFLPDVNWNVQVIKENEISRFYYKITYKTLQ